ncbi:retrotransposon protein, putative, ty1-copia subclass [Tanacetum coccineum]
MEPWREFQRVVSSDHRFYDHLPYKCNADDFERGANFRDLPNVIVNKYNEVGLDTKVERKIVASGKPLVPDYALKNFKGKSSKPFRRLWSDEIVSTVVTRPQPHNQAIIHRVQDRVLTVRENARLRVSRTTTSFLGPSEKGNAMAVPVARALGYSLAMSCKESRSICTYEGLKVQMTRNAAREIFHGAKSLRNSVVWQLRWIEGQRESGILALKVGLHMFTFDFLNQVVSNIEMTEGCSYGPLLPHATETERPISIDLQSQDWYCKLLFCVSIVVGQPTPSSSTNRIFYIRPFEKAFRCQKRWFQRPDFVILNGVSRVLPAVINEQKTSFRAEYKKHSNVACIMLGKMSPALQRQFENYPPQNMLAELRKMFEKPPAVEIYDLVDALHSCKQAPEGNTNKDSLSPLPRCWALKRELSFIPNKDQDCPPLPRCWAIGRGTALFISKSCVQIRRSLSPVLQFQGFKEERKLSYGDQYLQVGNGTQAAVEAIGMFDLVLPSGLVLKLNNCYYAPSIVRGVVSLSCLLDLGFHHTIASNGISVSLNGIFYFSAISVNGVFEIDMNNNVPKNNNNSIFSINKKRKLDLDSSIFGTVDLPILARLACKSFIVKVFKAEVELQLGKKIKALRSDRGGEYLSQEFKDYLSENGIVQNLTSPYTPQQNGVSERRNRTLLDMVRSMFNLTTLPLSFWDYALESAVRILNMVPTKKVDKTPYEIWHGKAPNLSYLKDHPKETMVEDDVVDRPPNAKVVRSKWIFKKKTDMDGKVHTYKARLVAKGCTQTYGIDYEETFSPVADIRAIRILIAIAGYVDPNYPNGVCKLQRAIYGLKQASRQWNKRFDEEIKKFGFIQNRDEPCVYRKASGSDVILRLIGLNQSAYIDKILKKFNEEKKSLHDKGTLLLRLWDLSMYDVRCTTGPDVAFAQNLAVDIIRIQERTTGLCYVLRPGNAIKDDTKSRGLCLIVNGRSSRLEEQKADNIECMQRI